MPFDNPATYEPDGLDDTARLLPVEIDERAYDTEPALKPPADTRDCQKLTTGRRIKGGWFCGVYEGRIQKCVQEVHPPGYGSG